MHVTPWINLPSTRYQREFHHMCGEFFFTSSTFLLQFYFFIWRCRFFRVFFFVPFPLSLCMESTSYVLSFRMVFFLPCDDHVLDF